MLENTSRPPSVLITQVIQLMLGSLWIGAGVLNAVVGAMSATSSAQLIVNAFVGLVGASLGLVFVLGFWGLAKRKSYGRWIGVIGLSLLLLSIIIGNFVRPSGPLGYYDSENTMQFVGEVVASVIFYGIVIFLIYRLAKGRRANEFFAGETHPHLLPKHDHR